MEDSSFYINISFEKWCQNHEDDHHAKWCRELYPWEAISKANYAEHCIGTQQIFKDFIVLIKSKRPGKHEGRVEFEVHISNTRGSQAAKWKDGFWSNTFILICSEMGHFITLYTKKRDPSKRLLINFMNGEFSKIEHRRSISLSDLLFRSLVNQISFTFDNFSINQRYTFEVVREGYRRHKDIPPKGGAVKPNLSIGRDLWIMTRFSEEKAHLAALSFERQCRKLIVVYCRPTLTNHFRSSAKDTEVVSLVRFAQLYDTGNTWINQARFLMNNLREYAGDEIYNVDISSLSNPKSPEHILPSHLHEAYAALSMEITTISEAAYCFASANLINATINKKLKAFKGSPKLLKKKHYSFKGRVTYWIDCLLEHPIDGVFIYIDQSLIYINVSGVQFSFHSMKRTQNVIRHSSSKDNKYQDWKGIRLQHQSPTILAWARYNLFAENMITYGDLG